MKRVLEPELMDDAAQALAYAEADFSEPNAHFVDLLAALAGDSGVSGPVLDLGCGPAEISLRITRRWPSCEVDAVDGSAAMLAQARDRLQGEGAERVRLIESFIPSDALASAHYRFIVSNSLLHHLHDPSGLWETIRRCRAEGARVLVMDLARPESPERAQAIVETYAADEAPVLKEDFYNSLLAAFEPGEVRAQLDAAGLSELTLRQVSDRHFTVSG